MPLKTTKLLHKKISLMITEVGVLGAREVLCGKSVFTTHYFKYSRVKERSENVFKILVVIKIQVLFVHFIAQNSATYPGLSLSRRR